KATQPKSARQGYKRPDTMIVAKQIDTDAARLLRQLETEFAMALGGRLVAPQMVRHAQHPLGHYDSGCFADFSGNGCAALCDRKRGAEIANSNKEDIEPGEQAQLILPVPQRIGLIEAAL